MPQQNITPITNMGTIKRSNSKQKQEERPSTAPDKESRDNKYSAQPAMERLPSPAVKCNSKLMKRIMYYQIQQKTLKLM